jgi:hypothetical protein
MSYRWIGPGELENILGFVCAQVVVPPISKALVDFSVRFKALAG